MFKVNIVCIENYKIAEEWDVLDLLGLMQQLGAVPELAQTRT